MPVDGLTALFYFIQVVSLCMQSRSQEQWAWGRNTPWNASHFSLKWNAGHHEHIRSKTHSLANPPTVMIFGKLKNPTHTQENGMHENSIQTVILWLLLMHANPSSLRYIICLKSGTSQYLDIFTDIQMVLLLEKWYLELKKYFRTDWINAAWQKQTSLSKVLSNLIMQEELLKSRIATMAQCRTLSK